MNTMKETELAQHFVDYYQDYEVYKEVPMSGGRCDIVVRAGPVIIAIEVKLSLNTTVIAQAMRHIGYAHYVNIAIPKRSRPDGYIICKELGIGILEYDPKGKSSFFQRRYSRGTLLNQDSAKCYVHSLLEARYYRPILLPRLNDQMKLAVAGAQHNSMSEYKVTVLEIAGRLHNYGGKASLKEFFSKEGSFHYSTVQSARQCIKTYAEAGMIPEFRCEDGYLILNP